MFTQHIAFIVGAGASAEYGMPTGMGLLNRIAPIVKFNSSRHDNPELINLFIDQIKLYEPAGLALAKYIESGVTSIDDALTWFSSRKEVVDLGKAAIAYEILKAERSSPLYSATSELSPDVDFDDTWMPHFLSMVMSGHKNENAENAFGKVSIINFNYDRIIEKFIYSALQHKYGLEESRARRIVIELNMFRPYGTVGALPWQSEAGLAFGATSSNAELRAASKNIFTFSEGFTEEARTQISLALEKSRVAVFLGFGFHNQNMELLRVQSSEPWRRAYATTLGVPPENRRDMEAAIARTVGSNQVVPLLLDWSAHKLLTDLRLALMTASAM
jgi:hypothetical protein